MTPLEHVPVKSTNLKSAAYDPAAKRLEVIFTNGSHYAYHEVAPHHYQNLITHASAGSYFHSAIRNAHRAEKIK